MVVLKRDELCFHFGTGSVFGEHGVPHMGRSVVFRSSENTDVDELLPVAKIPAPVNPGMGADNDVCIEVFAKFGEQMGGGGGRKQEFVHPPGRSVTEEDPFSTHRKPVELGKLSQPFPVWRGGLLKRVLITDSGVVIISRVGVAALAIRKSVSDAVVVVSLHDLDAVVPEEIDGSVRLRAEGTKVAKAIHRVGGSVPSVLEGSAEGNMIAVDAPEKGDGSTHSKVTVEETLEQMDPYA